MSKETVIEKCKRLESENLTLKEIIRDQEGQLQRTRSVSAPHPAMTIDVAATAMANCANANNMPVHVVTEIICAMADQKVRPELKRNERYARN